MGFLSSTSATCKTDQTLEAYVEHSLMLDNKQNTYLQSRSWGVKDFVRFSLKVRTYIEITSIVFSS